MATVASRTKRTSSTLAFFYDALNLAELIHQPHRGVKATCGINDHDIYAVLGTLGDCIESNGGRIRAFLAADGFRAHAAPQVSS